MNYHMNKIDSTLSELLNMLVTVEGTLNSSRGIVLVVEQASSKKKSSFKKKKKPHEEVEEQGQAKEIDSEEG